MVRLVKAFRVARDTLESLPLRRPGELNADEVKAVKALLKAGWSIIDLVKIYGPEVRKILK